MTRPVLASQDGLNSDGVRLFNNAIFLHDPIVPAQSTSTWALSVMHVNRTTYWHGYINVGWPDTYPLPNIPGRVTFTVDGAVVYDSGWVIGVQTFDFTSVITGTEFVINMQPQKTPPNTAATGQWAARVSLYE